MSASTSRLVPAVSVEDLGQKTGAAEDVSPRRAATRPVAGSARVTAAAGTARSTSPARPAVAPNELDHRSIVALSHLCAEDLDVKNREKAALVKLLAELKKKKMHYEAKTMKKRKEVDSTTVKTMELEKKLRNLNNANRMMSAELSGVRSESEKLEAEVVALRRDFKEASASFEREVADVEKLKQTLLTYRREINAETKQRDSIQQDLRASRTAQNLMIHRLDDMEKRSRALKTCVADTFNT